MKFKEAIGIICGEITKGYMVSFEEKDGLVLKSDHFPDKNAGEDLIETKEQAWELAKLFASKTKGRMVNIYIIDENFMPIKYSTIIKNR